MLNLVEYDLKNGISKKTSEELKQVKRRQKLKANNVTYSKSSTGSSKANRDKKGTITDATVKTQNNKTQSRSPYNKNRVDRTANSTSKKHKHTVDSSTRKVLQDNADSYAFPQATQGFVAGLAKATTGLNYPASDKLKNSTAYKVGDMGGTAYGYSIGYNGAKKLVGKAVGKIAGTEIFGNAVSKAAGTNIVQNAARKALTKAGQNATEKAVAHASKALATKVGKGLVRNTVSDATVGTLMNSNIARADGLKVGSKEWAKSMGINAALDFGLGGAIEVLPTAIKGATKGSSKHWVETIVDGQKKYTRVNKSYKDYAAESLAKKEAKAAKEAAKRTAKETAEQTTEYAGKTYKSNTLKSKASVKEARLKALKESQEQAEALAAKQAAEQTAKGTVEETAKSTAKKTAKNAAKKTAEEAEERIKENALEALKHAKTKAEREKIFDELVEYEIKNNANTVRNYKGKGVTYDWHPDPERLDLGWDPMSFGWTTRTSHNDDWYRKFYAEHNRPPRKKEAEEVARQHMYEDLEHYMNNPTKEGDWELGATEEVKDLYRELRREDWMEENVSNFRKRNVNEPFTYDDIKLIDTNPDFGRAYIEKYGLNPDEIAAEAKKLNMHPSDYIEMKEQEYLDFGDFGTSYEEIAENGLKWYNDVVEPAAKNNVNLDDAVKDTDFLKYLTQRSNGRKIPDIAAENGISVNEQTKRFYKDYLSNKTVSDTVETAAKNVDNVAETAAKNGTTQKHKDLGADVFHESTHEINAKKYGEKDGVVNGTPFGETSQGARTIYNSDLPDETAKKEFKEIIQEGTTATYTLRNDTAIKDAEKAIKERGVDDVYTEFRSILSDGKMAHSRDIAKGYKLAEHLQNQGDYKRMMDVLSDVVTMESEAGRTLQAMRIFNSLSPQGRVKSLQRNIQKLETEMGKKLEISEDLLDELLKASTEQEIAQAKKNINKDVWNQIPANWLDKANAWRYLSMLSSPKTHVRNVLGNALFVPVKGMRNIVATGLEKALVKDGAKTKAILTSKDKNLIQMGKEDFAKVYETLSGNTKYVDSNARDLDAKIFNNKALEFWRKLNTNLLEFEDKIFMGFAYRRAYAQNLKANGFTAENATAEALANARKYASAEALNSTYRDASALADMLANAKRYSKMPTNQIPAKYGAGEQRLKKIGSTALEATIPFSKTPINILRRGFDYSPAGLIQGMTKILKAGGDNEALIDGISKFASGLTGTGILTVGAYMGYRGMAKGSLDTSSKEGKYKSQNGEQAYSIEIGDHSYTFDWAAPISMPFFVGAELGTIMQTGDLGIEDFGDAMTKITDPIFNLSMLSGLNTALDVNFADNPVMEVAKNIAGSYVGQYIPAVAGQAAKTIASEKKTSVSTNSNAMLKKLESSGRQTANKIPLLNNITEPYVDLWGNTEQKKNAADYLGAFAQNLFSPGTYKHKTTDKVNTEIKNLGERLGGDMNDIVPSATSKKEYDKKFGTKTYHMTEKDLTAYNKEKGSYAYNELNKLFSTKKYQNMSDDEKRKAIKNVYDDAKDVATQKFLESQGISKDDYTVSKMSKTMKAAYKKSGMDVKQFEKLYSAKQNVDETDGAVTTAMKLIDGGASSYKQAQTFSNGMSERAYNNAKNLNALGIKPKAVTKIANKADADGNGSLKTSELVNYLNSTEYSETEKAYIFAALGPWNAHNPYYQ